MSLTRKSARVAQYAGAQGVAQLLAFASGVLIVRALDKSVYGQYGIAVSLIAMLTFLSDSGGTSVLMSRGAALIGDRPALGALFREGARFRHRFGWLIAGAGSVILWFLLALNGSSPALATLFSVTVLITFIPILTVGVFQALHRLDSRVTLLQNTTLGVAALRLLLVASVASIGLGSVEIFLIVNLVCSSITALVYWSVARPLLRMSTRDPSLQQYFRVAAVKVFPMILMVVGGEQLYLLFLAWRSPAEIVSEAMALSRFAVAFVVVNAVIADVLAPWLARTPAFPRLVLRRVATVLGLYTLASAVIVLAIALAAPLLLMLLGDEYAGLEAPMVMFAAGYALFYVGLSWDSINQSRGWVHLSWVYLPLVALWAMLSFVFIDMSSINGVAVLFGTLALPMLLTQCVRTARGLRVLRKAGSPK